MSDPAKDRINKEGAANRAAFMTSAGCMLIFSYFNNGAALIWGPLMLVSGLINGFIWKSLHHKRHWVKR